MVTTYLWFSDFQLPEKRTLFSPYLHRSLYLLSESSATQNRLWQLFYFNDVARVIFDCAQCGTSRCVFTRNVAFYWLRRLVKILLFVVVLIFFYSNNKFKVFFALHTFTRSGVFLSTSLAPEHNKKSRSLSFGFFFYRSKKIPFFSLSRVMSTQTVFFCFFFSSASESL